MVASTQTVLRVGFVPEHFSSPLHMAVELGFFEKEGVIVERVCCPSGTGEMTAKLIDGSLDVAIALTEGLLAGIAKGHDAYKIIGTYVKSPLCWAISVGQNSRHVDRKSLRDGTIGISRVGSGSHIIPYVLAEQEGWLKGSSPSDPEYKAPFEFKVLNTFQNMRDSVNDGSSDAFLWEKFTTKPYHDSNEVRSVDTITPPWPSFMIAASVRHLPMSDDPQRQTILAKFLRGLSNATQHFVDPENYNESIAFVQQKMSYTQQDVQDWFSGVCYPKEGCSVVSRESLITCASILVKAGVLQKEQEKDVKASVDTKYVDANVAQLV
ncbi:hypothetical protein BGZ80_011425 [Entomortierella chlamydospora]|uniref:Ca3427-like PBP 2 domain-containing protein n=1 Tax=Entomortierella chlamydospora TaxID=101097 RepID=A0A9P6SZM3_9FUNG|nr:hypothetical protein BGZ79_009093 [Entomortierella chlamydospora]KAG0012906.1 hypothetical protein BGZ80_011425 [Entomortierella chlamydospora]